MTTEIKEYKAVLDNRKNRTKGKIIVLYRWLIFGTIGLLEIGKVTNVEIPSKNVDK